VIASSPIIAHNGGRPVSTSRPKVPSPSAEQVGRDDDPLRREPVRRDAADEREHQRRRDLGGEYVGQVGGGVGGLEHRERHADHGEPHRRRRDQPVREQEAEIPDAEHGIPAEEPTR